MQILDKLWKRASIFFVLWAIFFYVGGIIAFRIHPVGGTYWVIGGWQIIVILPAYLLLEAAFKNIKNKLLILLPSLLVASIAFPFLIHPTLQLYSYFH